jgi:N-acyl-D-aspartate/D-glutamate deacylase
MPARVLRPALDSRGILEDGAIADLTIFDPEKVEGAATVANPNQFSKGIETVIVNGSIAYHQGELRAAQGEAISLGLSRPREMR